MAGKHLGTGGGERSTPDDAFDMSQSAGAQRGLINTPELFTAQFNVSRETIADLLTYERLIRQWQPIKNLVAPKTLDEIWHRHFADSAQLARFATPGSRWVDLGAGAGFPGLVLAIVARNDSIARLRLVESNARKCAFLRDVARQTGTRVVVSAERIEDVAAAVPDEERLADFVTARALAPLARLFDLSVPFFGPQTRALFLKGRGVEAEIREAEAAWRFAYRLHPSLTDADAHVVEIWDLKPAD